MTPSHSHINLILVSHVDIGFNQGINHGNEVADLKVDILFSHMEHVQQMFPVRFSTKGLGFPSVHSQEKRVQKEKLFSLVASQKACLPLK